VGITNEDINVAQKFLGTLGPTIEYHFAVDSSGSANNSFMKAFNVRGIPHAFIVGRDQKISWHGHPLSPEISKEIEQALQPKIDPKSLSQDQLNSLSVKDLKQILSSKNVDSSKCVEKTDLILLVQANL